jgi:phosphomannomutase
VGYDIRTTSPEMSRALARGLVEMGVEVFDLGLCGTEEVYFSVFHHRLDGGIMVTASHNPIDYNGMKLVRAESRPVSGDSGLHQIRDLSLAPTPPPQDGPRGSVHPLESRSAFVRHLLTYVQRETLKPLKIVMNPGNGCAGPLVDLLCPHLPFEVVKIHWQPDGSFPNGIPNPLLPGNRTVTAEAVRANRADLGIAWDGDFDRCFFFDDQGTFIEGYYVVGLLAEAFLQQTPGSRIIHDPRLTWNTIDLVQSRGGVPIQSKTGHAFIKERMRQEDAVYGGEMSAHHYFRDFSYCDSGMIPWLLVTQVISATGKSLSELVGERMRLFPASGEINRRVADVKAVLSLVESTMAHESGAIDRTDGLSMDFASWRFNLRGSNTEPVLRLNVESRQDENLMREKTDMLLDIIGGTIVDS